jgi:heme-degrading monooxygenase HmoA
MICRIWRGLTRPDDAERYVEHLHRSTLPQLRELPGFVDASILRRDVARGTEFVVVTRWSSLKAIEQFAGADYTVAVVPPEVQRMMIDYDHAVRHYDIVD